MKYLTTTKLAAVFLAMSGLAATTAFVQAQQGNASEEALRELGIMRNIFGAALQSEGRKGYNRYGNMGAPEALYLAGQGMVFTFHLNGGGGGYVVVNGNQFAIPAVPAPPVVSFDGDDFDFDYDYDFDFDFDFDFDRNGDPRYAEARAQQRAYRDQVQALNEDIRDKQQDLREMQREIRELQRDQRNDEDVDNEAKIKEQQAAMEAAMQEMTEQGTRMQQLQQEYQTEQLAAFEAARGEQTALIFSTLCDYGNTLRSLSNGEHVNIVLRNYTDGQTQVHVFDYADFANCSSADALRQAGNVYIQDSRGF